MQLIWLTCILVLCCKRNNRLFNHKENIIHQLLHNVKTHSYWWIKVANANFVLGVQNWFSYVPACIFGHRLVWFYVVIIVIIIIIIIIIMKNTCFDFLSLIKISE